MRAKDKGAMLAALREAIEMTKIKLCGLSRPEDIAAANAVTAGLHRLCVCPKEQALCQPEPRPRQLKAAAGPGHPGGGRVRERGRRRRWPHLLKDGVIDVAQLHGDER